MSLLAVLTAAMITPSGAAAKAVLVLKEEGKPVAAGAELGVELETVRCKVIQRAHLSVNGAKKDRLTVEPPAQENTPCTPERNQFFEWSTSGGVQAVTMAAAGSAKLQGMPLRIRSSATFGPMRICVHAFRKFSGAFPVPGRAVIEGTMVGTLTGGTVQEEPHSCQSRARFSFTVKVLGGNSKPLETELIG
jgi:hypothetical protein